MNVVWRRFYQISFFFGYVVAGGLYWVFCVVSPPPGVGVQVDFDVDGRVLVVDGDGGSEVSLGNGVVEKQGETVGMKPY